MFHLPLYLTEELMGLRRKGGRYTVSGVIAERARHGFHTLVNEGLVTFEQDENGTCWEVLTDKGWKATEPSDPGAWND